MVRLLPTLFAVAAAVCLSGHGAWADGRDNGDASDAKVRLFKFGSVWAPESPAFATVDIAGRRFDGRVVYYTPRVAGVQIGVAYTDGTTAGIEPVAGFGGMRSVGASYQRRVGGVGLAAFGSASVGEAEYPGTEADTAWSLGGHFSYRGFGLRGSYLKVVAGELEDEHELYELSANYASGAWSFGLGFQRAEDPAGVEPGTDAYSLGVAYAIGAGVTLAGGLRVYDYQSGEVAGGSGSALEQAQTILMIGTAVRF